MVERLIPAALELPGYLANQLLLGRAAELAGDVPIAYAAFRAIAPHDALALRRTGELHPRAIEIVANRLGDALRRGRVDDAEAQLVRLREWAPAEPVTFEAARDIAVARGDLAAELAAVRWLAERRTDDRALLERRADLELSVGDPGAGLELSQALADRYPQDQAAAERLAAAKFRWRLSMLPEGVQATAGKPQLTRADLAVLLYWLVPNVRYGRPSSGRIATDVLDHPQQEEIVRVVNLGLMDVDGTLHRFSPAAPARRFTALRSLVRLLSLYGQGVACAAGIAGNPQPSQSAACRTGAACGLLASEADCLPQAPVSGSEVVELDPPEPRAARSVMTFTLPNLLSILRMGLVPVFVIALVEGEPGKALAIFVVAGVTDALDGFIARFWNQRSLLGAYLDPAADKLLLTSAWIVLSIPTLNQGTTIPIWVTILVIARDVLIVVMALILFLAVGVKKFPPSILSKLTTATQVAAVAAVLATGLFHRLEPIADALVYLVALVTVASGLDYILRSSSLVESVDGAGRQAP